VDFISWSAFRKYEHKEDTHLSIIDEIIMEEEIFKPKKDKAPLDP
jgi:hypothetical protein